MRMIPLVSLVALALVSGSLGAVGAPLYGDNPCGSSLTSVDCAVIIKNSNLDNVSTSMVTGGSNPGSRVDLRDKSTPDTYYWFTSGADPLPAKSVLAVLLSAKATGASVKLWITWSAGTGGSRQFSWASMVDP